MENKFFDIVEFIKTNDILLNNFLQVVREREKIITDAIASINLELMALDGRIEAVIISHKEMSERSRRVLDQIERLTGNFEVEQ